MVRNAGAGPSGSTEVILAMGMVIAPFSSERRAQVRATMLQYDPVLKGSTVFRFVIGREMPTLEKQLGSQRSAAALQELTRESATHGDIAMVDALDGKGVSVACSCGEKQTAWVRYALRRWPNARFIGKTEDDTYLQLATLEAELRTLTSARNVMYGYMTLGVMPTRPTRYPEKSPFYACVTAAHNCRKSRLEQKDRKGPGRGSGRGSGKRRGRGVKGAPAAANGTWHTEGCFLGDLESKPQVPGGPEDFVPGASGLVKRDKPSAILKWWTEANEQCGMPARDSGEPGSTIAPFPTGPLAVFGRDLATSLFLDCAYVREYERSGRAANRRTLCAGEGAHLSYNSILCDTVLGHWLAKCELEASVVHTTRTKSHHYMWRAAGLGWMPPSNLSLAVHFLKAAPDAKSGPGNTVGGEWAHVHETLTLARGVGFPSIRYRFAPGFTLEAARSRDNTPLLRTTDPHTFQWYTAECSFDHPTLRTASRERAIRATESVRGQRPAGLADAKYLGGHPPGWTFSGCNPSRFRPYPRWPPVSPRGGAHPELNPYSDTFVYYGHGPTAEQLLPSARAAIRAAEAEPGGLVGLQPSHLFRILQKAAAPHPLGAATKGGDGAHWAMRTQKAFKRASRGAAAASGGGTVGELGRSASTPEAVLLERMHARASVEAYAEQLRSAAAAGLAPHKNARDDTYRWTWA